jgi:hypothetical protein
MTGGLHGMLTFAGNCQSSHMLESVCISNCNEWHLQYLWELGVFSVLDVNCSKRYIGFLIVYDIYIWLLVATHAMLWIILKPSLGLQ